MSFLKGARFTKIMLFLILISVILLTIWLSLLQFRLPEVVSSDADGTEFSAERAMVYLDEIASEPRPLGSEAHDRTKEYLVSTLNEFGLSPEIQEQWVSTSNYEGNIANIVARIPGEDSSAAIMITAHYDSVAGSPGAADDGSGVAAMLETARILANGPTLKNDVIILFSDAEEIGLLGAQAFVNDHSWASDVGVVINVEARGNKGPAVLFETSDRNDRLITLYANAVPDAVANSLFYEIYKKLPNNTDLSIYKGAGMHGYNIALFEGGTSYHSSTDTVENISINSLQQIGDSVQGLVENLGFMALVEKEEGNRVYFNLIGNKVVSYLEKIVIPLMIASIIVFFSTFIHGYIRKKLTIRGTLGSFLLFLLTVGLAYYIGLGLYELLLTVFADRRWILFNNNYISNAIFIISIVLLLAIFTSIYTFASKKIKSGNLALGAYMAWLLLVAASSILIKGISYIFVWPLLFGLIALNLSFLLKDEQSVKGYMIHIGLQVPVLLITAPVIYLVYVFWSLEAIASLFLAVGLIGAFIISMVSTMSLLKLK